MKNIQTNTEEMKSEVIDEELDMEKENKGKFYIVIDEELDMEKENKGILRSMIFVFLSALLLEAINYIFKENEIIKNIQYMLVNNMSAFLRLALMLVAYWIAVLIFLLWVAKIYQVPQKEAKKIITISMIVLTLALVLFFL